MKRKEDFSKLTTAQLPRFMKSTNVPCIIMTLSDYFPPKQKATIIIAITTVHRASILNIF